jgi:hypothetical protein
MYTCAYGPIQDSIHILEGGIGLFPLPLFSSYHSLSD